MSFKQLCEFRTGKALEKLQAIVCTPSKETEHCTVQLFEKDSKRASMCERKRERECIGVQAEVCDTGVLIISEGAGISQQASGPPSYCPAGPGAPPFTYKKYRANYQAKLLSLHHPDITCLVSHTQREVRKMHNEITLDIFYAV